jgi:charged multivesicular body protein 2A
MKGVTRAMRSMNQQMNLPQITKIMSEFEKQSEIMDMKEEMMSDAMDDAMGEGDEEGETEQVVQQVNRRWFTSNIQSCFQVLDELGIQLTEEMNKLPAATDTLNGAVREGGQRQPQAAMASASSGTVANDIDADLQARLENLRREWTNG